MEPFYTLLICLPAALVLIACACGWPSCRPRGPGPPIPPRSAGGVAGGVQHEAGRSANTYGREAVGCSDTHTLRKTPRRRPAMGIED